MMATRVRERDPMNSNPTGVNDRADTPTLGWNWSFAATRLN